MMRGPGELFEYVDGVDDKIGLDLAVFSALRNGRIPRPMYVAYNKVLYVA
jgi:hypothetical protein